MNRGLLIARRLLLVVLLIGCGGFGYISWSIANPVDQQLPLPAALIASDSPEGVALLAGAAAKADYAALEGNFEAQRYGSYCGVASSVIAIKALGGEASQETFFDGAAGEQRSSWRTFYGGMTLEQLAALLRAHDLEASATHAGDTTLEAFRSEARENLNNTDDFLLINYSRASLNQGSSGHISPLAAYDASSDRFLVLDVSAYKYPPVWVEAPTLFEAMNTADTASNRTRGFVVVRGS